MPSRKRLPPPKDTPPPRSTDEPSIPIAPAADLIVANFSGRTMASLATPEGREEAKATLTAQIVEHYGETVATVFLTEFVMQ